MAEIFMYLGINLIFLLPVIFWVLFLKRCYNRLKERKICEY